MQLIASSDQFGRFLVKENYVEGWEERRSKYRCEVKTESGL